MNATNLLDRLLKQLEARGLQIGRGEQPGELVITGPDAELTPTVMEALKTFKPQLVERFRDAPVKTVEQPEPRPVEQPAKPTASGKCGMCKGRGFIHDWHAPGGQKKCPECETPESCRVCGKDVSDPETRERMADPLFCDQGGCNAVTDGNGVKHPEMKRCPFKEKA